MDGRDERPAMTVPRWVGPVERQSPTDVPAVAPGGDRHAAAQRLFVDQPSDQRLRPRPPRRTARRRRSADHHGARLGAGVVDGVGLDRRPRRERRGQRRRGPGVDLACSGAVEAAPGAPAASNRRPTEYFDRKPPLAPTRPNAPGWARSARAMLAMACIE